MALLSFCLCGWLRSTKGTKSTKGVRGPFGCGWGVRAPFGGRCAGLRPHLRASRWSSPPGGEEGGRNVVRVIGLCAKFVRAGRARSVAVRASILDRSRASRGGRPYVEGWRRIVRAWRARAIHRARRGGGSRAADRDARHKRIIALGVAEYVTGKRVKSTGSCLGEVAARPLTNGGRLDNPYRSCVKE